MITKSLSKNSFSPILKIMETMIPIIIGVALIISIIIGIIVINRHSFHKQGEEKTQEEILKTINKKLAQNPRDPESLYSLAEIYFNEENWDNAFKTYKILEELEGTYQNIDTFQLHVRFALSALLVGEQAEAFQGFTAAWALRQDNLEVNYNLGNLEFQQKNYEKAIQYLSLARRQSPDHVPTLRCLGYSFFKLLKYKESMAFIRKALELSPDDNESLYILAECYVEVGHTEPAVKIFTHIRLDPKLGAKASLFAGTLNMNQHQIDQAIENFEIGLKHEGIEPEIIQDLRYGLAIASIKKNEIGKAVTLLNTIQEENPNYKDVPQLIDQYKELNSNKNLQIFMLASSVDFVNLCRKIVSNYSVNSKTKIVNVAVNRNEWVDISAEVESIQWSDTIIFRFVRSQGSVGELMIRDFHSRLKELKAGRGVCITVGTFSEEARRYTEARLIDLIEKEKLLPLLAMIDGKIKI